MTAFVLRRPCLALAICCAVLDLLAASSPAPAQSIIDSSRAALIQSVLPTVVNITARGFTEPDKPENASATAAAPAGSQIKIDSGSGFVIDPTGLILTNWHVVKGAYDIAVTFHDGSHAQAQVAAHTAIVDLALLRVAVGHTLPAVTWGDSDKVQIGDPVIAIGNPLGIGTSVSAGLVSALDRNISDTPYDEFIQTDAAINHGNSGGPMFDLMGHVIGVNSAIISPTAGSAGLGFAVPANHARFAVDWLLKYGELRPGWLGIAVQPVTPEIAAGIGMEGQAGSIVGAVEPNGPAERAGLHTGDVILRVDDSMAADDRALLRNIATRRAGEVVHLAVWRDGRTLTLTASVASWPQRLLDAIDPPVHPRTPHHAITPDLGLTLGTPAPVQLASLGNPATLPGVPIAAVAPGSVAAERYLRPGDVILRVGTAPAETADAVRAAFAAARSGTRPYLPLLVLQAHRPNPKWIAVRVLPD